MSHLQQLLFYFQISVAGFGGIFSIWALIDSQLSSLCGTSCSDTRMLFNLSLTISQFMPGPKITSLALLAHKSGIPFMFLILLALAAPGMIFIPLISKVAARYSENPYLEAFKNGASAAAISILILFAWSLIRENLHRNGSPAFVLTTILIFLLNYKYKCNAILCLILGAACGWLLLE